jgi:hypothetical protein
LERGGGRGVEEAADDWKIEMRERREIPGYECGKGGNCKMRMEVRELLEALQQHWVAHFVCEGWDEGIAMDSVSLSS